ncbi:MAG: hypothetical protein ABIF71_05865, partial [Planctomycetota bacterium]
GVRGLVAGANHGSYTSLMMRQCLTCLSNHHSAPHAKWIGYLFTGTKPKRITMNLNLSPLDIIAPGMGKSSLLPNIGCFFLQIDR